MVNKIKKYWDIGERDPYISMSKKKMADILIAIITCDGQILDTFSLGKKFNKPEFIYPLRNCSVVMRITLPEGMEEEFEKLSGCKLSEPIKVHLN